MADNKKKNFITGQLNNSGENWIVSMTPENIQRQAKRIFREMVMGQFDYEQVGEFFLDAKFLDNLIIAASNELEINTLYYNAVSFYIQYYPNYPNISVQQNHLQVLCYIYNTILQRLNYVKATNNIGCLHDISAFLYNYRNHLN